MIWAIIATCLWFVVANVGAMLPSRDYHWRFAYVLIVVGIPILGFLTYTAGPIAGLIALVAGASVLRWPLRRLFGRLALVLRGDGRDA